VRGGEDTKGRKEMVSSSSVLPAKGGDGKQRGPDENVPALEADVGPADPFAAGLRAASLQRRREGRNVSLGSTRRRRKEALTRRQSTAQQELPVGSDARS